MTGAGRIEADPSSEALARLRAVLRAMTHPPYLRAAAADPRGLYAGIGRADGYDEPELIDAEDGDAAHAPAQDATPAAVRDPLPEHTAYRDTGCHVAPSCLRCPLAVCIFDHHPQPRRHARQARDHRLRALAERGWTTTRLARRFDLSGSQVRRIRARRG